MDIAYSVKPFEEKGYPAKQARNHTGDCHCDTTY